MRTNEDIQRYIDSILYQMNKLSRALPDIEDWPGGEEAGRNEIFNTLMEAEDTLDSVIGFYV